MAELTDDQKLAVITYVKSIEEKKEDRLFSLIRNWSAIIGVSAIAVLAGFASYLENRAIGAAEKKVDDIAQAGKIDDASRAAYKAIFSAQAKGDALEANAAENLERSRKLLLELKGNLNVAQELTKQFKTAADVQAAINGLNAAKNDLVEAIAADPEIIKSILGDALVPKGAIAAFGQANVNGNCPLGWTTFEPATGRFIVGAGLGSSKDVNGSDLTDHDILATGGEEKHKLTETEIPSHSHAVYQHAGYHWPDIPNDQKRQPNEGATGGDTTTYVHAATTGPWGGDLPHNTMPPFVALYYCIKK